MLDGKVRKPLTKWSIQSITVLQQYTVGNRWKKAEEPSRSMTLRKLLEVQSPSVRRKREPVTKLISEVRGSTHYSLASQLSKIVRHGIAIPSELNIVDG